MGHGHCLKCNSPEFVNLACSHVAKAISENKSWFEAEHFVYGDSEDQDLGIIYSGTFCRACIARLALPRSGSFLQAETVDAALEEVRGVCGGCLTRWHARHSEIR